MLPTTGDRDKRDTDVRLRAAQGPAPEPTRTDRGAGPRNRADDREDRYCIDILTQLGAVDTALEAVAIKVLEEHVRHCVAGALASGAEQQATEKSAELLEAVQRFAKTR
jgi:DNA-binding FrmR family transcriptional regulator